MKLSELRKAAREGVTVEEPDVFTVDLRWLSDPHKAIFRDYQEDMMKQVKSAFMLPPSHFACRTTVKWMPRSGDALKLAKSWI